jgi:hypothetical protein
MRKPINEVGEGNVSTGSTTNKEQAEFTRPIAGKTTKKEVKQRHVSVN